MLKGYFVRLNMGFATVGTTPEKARKRAAEMLAEMITESGTEGLMSVASVTPTGLTGPNPEEN